MCGVYYLGALRASEEMARAAGDQPFADECRRLFTSGSQWIDRNLFNGEHYVQKIRGIPVAKIAQPLRSTGGAEDPEHPDFQLGEGCLTDQLIGQYLADIAGLGPLLDAANIRKTLATIYRYNHRANLTHHDSVERIYALNDEAAVLICDYAKGKRPRIPFPYASEAWTGIEYLFATQLMYHGMAREGVQCFEDVRKRYDGERRNPWDEPECGHHYARAMSAWSGIVALSGFRYHGQDRSLIAAPRVRPGNFSSFWTTATAWGTFSQSIQSGRTRFSLSVLSGKLECRSVELAGEAAAGAKSAASLGTAAVPHELRVQDKRMIFAFEEALELAEGARLVLVT
jgi:non-lysosomal glucosylceramidase